MPTAGVFVIGNGFVGAEGSVREELAVQHTFNSFSSSHVVKTLFCGSYPLGPTVDRHLLVNSGARYS